MSINILPDDVLLEIFDQYVTQLQIYSYRDQHADAWHKLVHVCQRWRYVVFDSPRRLDLRLLCTDRTPVTNMLDIWPVLPIVISASSPLPGSGVTNIISALQQHNRVCTIHIDNVPNSLLKEFAAILMQEPFPALTKLQLWSCDKNAPVLPDSFLGGSPRLQSLELDGIPFPAIPKLLLSTHDLVTLLLQNIPRSGYISPVAMVTCLSTLTSLEALFLGFRSPRSQADRASRRPPPLTRIVLPALTSLQFRGDSEYLEDIVSQLEAPLLSYTDIDFFNQLIFDTPLLRHFISRTEIVREAYEAYVSSLPDNVRFRLYPRNGTEDVTLLISCNPLDWQISSLAQVCSSSFPPLPTLEHLHIDIETDPDSPLEWQDDMEDTQWLELLRPFTSVKDLDLSGASVPFISPALQELSGERVTEVLPALQNLFFTGPMPSGPVKEAIGKFIAARQLSGCPVTVHHRDDQRLTYRRWEVID